MTDGQSPEPLSAAEERLLVLLTALGAERATGGDSLEASVMRTARWQYLLRGVLVAVSDLLALIVDGALILLGVRRSPSSSEHAT
ncbi:MAG: hypothetical protein WKF33_08640 [Thermoleophilaceae bacterium]|nr:hypothetical protein [Actinomycetota bacterium]